MKERGKKWCMDKMLVVVFCSAVLFGGCYTEIEPDSPAERGGLLPIAGAYNVRDLGQAGYTGENGRKIKAGKLIRSGDLNLLTARDQNYLFGTMGIKTVVDFRGQKAGTDGNNAVLSERAAAPDRVPEGVTVVYKETAIEEGLLIGSYEDIIQEVTDADAATQKMADGYAALLTDPDGSKNAKAQFKAFFDTLLASEGKPVLYHCSAGKDRTGIATILLLSALGVDEEIIKADYLSSAEFVKEKYHPVSRFIANATGSSMKAQRDSDSVQNASNGLMSDNDVTIAGVKAGIKEGIKAGIRESIIAGVKAGFVDAGQDLDIVNDMDESTIDYALSLAGKPSIQQMYEGVIANIGGDNGLDAMVESQCQQIIGIAGMSDPQIDSYAIEAGKKVAVLVTVLPQYIDAAFNAFAGGGG